MEGRSQTIASIATIPLLLSSIYTRGTGHLLALVGSIVLTASALTLGISELFVTTITGRGAREYRRLEPLPPPRPPAVLVAPLLFTAALEEPRCIDDGPRGG